VIYVGLFCAVISDCKKLKIDVKFFRRRAIRVPLFL